MWRGIRICIVMILSMLFVACGGGDIDPADVLYFDENGYALEDFVPEASNFVMTYSTTESVQRGYLEDFFARFSDQEFFQNTLLPSEMFALELEALGIDYEADVKPMFGDEYRMLFAAHLDFSSEPKDPHGVIELYDTDTASGMMFVVTLDDVDKAYEVMNTLAEQEGMIEGNIDGHRTVADSTSGNQIMVIDDFLITAGSQGILHDVVARYNAEILALTDSQDYLRAVASFEEAQLGYFYMNMSGVDADSVTPFSRAAGVDMYQIYGVRADENGFVIRGFGRFDEAALKDLGVDFRDFLGEGEYMSDYLQSSDGFALYSESYNIARGLMSGPLLSDPSIGDSFEAFFGTQIQEGLLSWMDRGFAFAVHGGESFIPAVTLAFDASSNIEMADEFYTKLDAQLGGVLALAQMEGYDISKRAEGNLSIVSLDLDAFLGASAGLLLPNDMNLPDVELTYGLTEDQIFVVSLQSGFYEQYMSLEEDLVFESALSKIDGADGGVLFVGADVLRMYVGNVRDFIESLYEAQAAQLDISVEGAGSIELAPAQSELLTTMGRLETILAEFDYFIMASEITSKNEIRSRGYVELK